MNKKGFTLAEVLITIGLVGIIATITAPILSSIMPNEHKTRVIKYYKTVQDINNNLLNNPFYYYNFTEDGVEYSGLYSFDTDGTNFYGLYEQDESKYSSKYGGTQKYCYLLSENLELNGVISGSNPYIFELVDGTIVECNVSNGTNKVEYTLAFDINGDDDPNALGSSTQKRPDRFKFLVDNFGKITGEREDLLTQQYLKNLHKLNDKKADYNAAFKS